jgi:DNA repair protein RecN (Recombination protein N)
MLRTLHIRDFVIVDQAEIDFAAGFTVFSGETGAGKSILIDALSLALGGRADSSVVREGAPRADVSALFDIPEALLSWIADHAIPAEDGLVLRRVIDTQGRSRAFINGIPSTVTQLRELGDFLVDIHGQHAHQSLMRADAQRELLDAHGGYPELARAVAESWKSWRALSLRLEKTLGDAAGLAAERERLEWQASELDQLDLQPGEWDSLQTEQTRLAHAQTLLDGAAQTLAAIDGDDNGIHARLITATSRMAQLLRHDSALQGIHDELDSARPE